MGRDDAREALIANLADLNEGEALEIIRESLDAGSDPLAIMEDCQEGMRQVGERYEQGIYFISALIMAGEIFRKVMEMIQPMVEERLSGKGTGCILLGTVQGDIHDIGKNIAGSLLKCYGFTVHDLGVDVPPSEFLERAGAVSPDIIGLSGLLTSVYESMRETITALRGNDGGGYSTVPVLIGGSQLNDQVCEYVGADHWVDSAMKGVRICQQIMADKGEGQ